MAYLTEAEVREAITGDEVPVVRIQSILASASAWVGRIALAPDEPSASYESAAKAAEFIACEYLYETSGFLKSANTDGLSDTYGTAADVEGCLLYTSDAADE